MEDNSRRLKDVKAQQVLKRRKAKRRKRVIFLVVEIFFLIVMVIMAYGLVKYGKIDKNTFGEGAINVNEGVEQDGYTTIVLFGSDSRNGELGAGSRTDTMMVAAIDNETKAVKIVSVYRDTVTRQQDGKLKKANSAYAAGGPEAAINMLNENFDLDIQDYVTVDFNIVAEAVDVLGGIDVELAEAEAIELNKVLVECRKVTGKEADDVIAGQQHLNGVQALAFSRMRYNVGGDYARTDRQRFVVEKMVEKIKSNPLKINALLDNVLPKVSTSITTKEFAKLALGLLNYDIVETSGYPFNKTDGNISGLGSVVMSIGHVENVQELHAFLYPKNEYTPSETVKEIGQQIKKLTGY